MWKQITATAALVGLTACGGETLGVADQTTSSFGTAGNFGGVPSSGITSNVREGGGAGVGYGWVVGGGPIGGFAGAAGRTSGAFTSGLPTGVATYSGSYQLGAVENIVFDGTQVSGTSITLSGPISLIANVNTGALTGSGSDIDVNGTISGGDIGGSVTFRGLDGSTTGSLDGIIGSSTAIGAFHGNDSTTVFAGGFNVSN